MTEEKLVAALFLVCVEIFSQLLKAFTPCFLNTSSQNSGHFFFFSLIVLLRKKGFSILQSGAFVLHLVISKQKQQNNWKALYFCRGKQSFIGAKSQGKTSLIIVMATVAAAVVVD